jgi:hypothetical protein
MGRRDGGVWLRHKNTQMVNYFNQIFHTHSSPRNQAVLWIWINYYKFNNNSDFLVFFFSD